jgi:hypothetical protein
MDEKILSLFENWKQRNIEGLYFKDRESALDKILNIIPLSATVGISGSVTLDELGVVKLLESRGNKVFNQYKPDISRDQKLEIRNQGAQADYYLSSANAISQDGELVFLSAFGHRTAGIANAKNVIIVSGTNKLTPNLEEAIKRAKDYATPLNYKRLNWDPAKRMCCQELIIEAETAPGRLKVILIGENLGF